MKLEDGSPDSIEFDGLGQDDVLGTSTPRPTPEIITTNRKAFQDIVHHAYGIICHFLSHLDRHLSLKPGTLASFCPQNKPSQTMLRMPRSPPQTIGSHRTNLIGHTDLGSMVMLFNAVGGLQLLPAGSENVDENWVYIRPDPGCAVINLGDAMVQWKRWDSAQQRSSRGHATWAASWLPTLQAGVIASTGSWCVDATTGRGRRYSSAC